MKYLSVFFLIAATVLALFSCKSTSTSIDVLQPAEINLPEHIQVIATMDRSKPESGWATALEGLFSGEQILQDRSGRTRAVEGVTSLLTRTPRFSVVHTGLEMVGSKSGSQFPPLLDWTVVRDICEQHKADALLAIELFDSDAYTAANSFTRTVKDEDGNEIKEKYYNADRSLNLKMGWRLYDVKNERILDQHITRDETSDAATGSSKVEAISKLTSPAAIVDELAFRVGELYGMRIAPVWIKVNRQFYKTAKGDSKEAMEKAARLAKSGEWSQAAEIWRAILLRSTDRKTKGYAAHNMAVANERSGSLDSALDWAKKAYLNFGNKKSKNYIGILRLRISDQKKVEEQMRDADKP